MKDWAVVLGATAFVAFIFGAVAGMALGRVADMRDAAAYALVRDSLEALTQEVANCQYHVNQAKGDLSSLEGEVAAWMKRRGRR